MSRRAVNLVAGAFIGLALCSASLAAQSVDTSCTYARCALGILPRLTALDVVRGVGEERVGSLAFLFPRDVQGVFASNESAKRHAAHALSLRRVGAALTFAGGVLLVTGAVHAAASRNGRVPWAAAAGVGVATFGASVPVHFAADAELSRAVWAFNRDLTTSGR